MRKLIYLAMCLASGAGFALCQDVYNPNEGVWVYECTPQPSDPRPPLCQSQYDPMNGVWVMVCN